MSKKVFRSNIILRNDPVICKFLRENVVLINDLQEPKFFFMVLNEIEKLRGQFKEINFLAYDNSEILGRKTSKVLNAFFKKIDRIERKIPDGLLMSKLKSAFRESFKEYFYKSSYIKHGYLKPRGYPGDYKLLEAMYDNRSELSVMGFLFDQYFLNDSYVKAVRDRKNRMKEFLKDFIENCPKKKISILNVACGGCRETRELFENGFTTEKNVDFIFIDQDKDALRFARSKIGTLSPNYTKKFIAGNVGLLYGDKINMVQKLGGQDLIYNIGLADYLPDGILSSLIKFCYILLNKNGRLIIAHKNVTEYSALAPDWMCDWHFIPREKEELHNIIITNLPKEMYKSNISFDKNKLMFYAIIDKLSLN